MAADRAFFRGLCPLKAVTAVETHPPRFYIADKKLVLFQQLTEALEAITVNLLDPGDLAEYFGFTEEEKLQFASLLERAILNMGGSPCQKRKEEETK